MKLVSFALFALPLASSSHLGMRMAPSISSLRYPSAPKSNILAAAAPMESAQPPQRIPPAHSKLLALRGGMDNDLLINVMAALNILIGLQGWLGPGSTLKNYGAEDITEDESVFVRILSSFNVVSGVTLLADESAVASVCLIAWALATSANCAVIPQDVPRGPIIGSVAVFGLLGELAREGKLDAGLATNILSFFLIPVSLLEIVLPKLTFDSFKMPSPSPLSKSIFENFSWTKLGTGVFVLVSKLTGRRGLGLGAAAVTSTLNCVKTITRADKVGLKKPGLIIWAVLNAAIAAVAFKNEN